MKVVISGYYGFGNVGDEAVLDSIITNLRSVDPDIKITVLSADPAGTSSHFGVKSIKRYSFFSIIKELSSCDVLISGGGGLLQDSTGRFTIAYYLGIIFIANMLLRKFVILGQGYGPVNKVINKWLVKMILNSADLITIRDERSFDEIRKDGVINPPMLVTADPAFLLEKTKIVRMLWQKNLHIESKPAIGVCLRPLLKRSKDFYDRMALFLDSICDKYDLQALFIPFYMATDAQESVKVASLMKHKSHIVLQSYSPREMLGLIDSLDAVIGIRLHSLIFGAISGVPMMGIDYDPKVRSLLEELECPIVIPDDTVDEMINKFDRIWRDRHKMSGFLIKKSESLKEKARLNFSTFVEYTDLEKGANLLGVKIDNLTMQQTIELVDEFVNSGKPHIIVTPNPEIIMKARDDAELKEILNSADIAIPDGIGVIAAAKLLNINVAERLTGIDLMTGILRLAQEKSYKVFLLGSAHGVAEEAAINMKGVNVVGTHHGYFSEDEDKAVIEKIKAVKPDIFFVGLGAPRQEKWLSKYYKEIGAPVNMVIGGSLDVLSGRVMRAPGTVQKLGVEWFYRLVKEPRRWRRQTALAKFMALVLEHKLLGLSNKD